LKALWELKQIVKSDGVANENREAAQRHFRKYVESLTQSKTALPKWRDSLPFKPANENFLAEPLELIERMIKEMTETASSLNCNSQ